MYINYNLQQQQGNCRYQTLPPVHNLLPLRTMIKSNSVAPLANTLKIHDYTRCSMAPMSILPTSRAIWLPRSIPIMWKDSIIHKTGSIITSEEDRATTTVYIYRKFCEVWTRGSWDMLADRHTSMQIDRQTDRHTDMPIAIQSWTLHPYRRRSNYKLITTTLDSYICRHQHM